MSTVDSALQPITGYLISVTRNTVEGWYELEIGIHKTWVYNETDSIKCEIISESLAGKLIKISPKKSHVIIDDLIAFVETIIEINQKIADKEKQFTDKMEEMKGMLEKEAKKFYEELDELRENSFKNINTDETEKKIRKPRTAKTVTVSGLTETYIPPTIKTDDFPK